MITTTQPAGPQSTTADAVVERSHQTEERYRTLFDSIDEGFCVVKVILDADGKAVDHRFVEINPAFERLTGLHNAVGRTAREIIPSIAPERFEIYGRVLRSGEPARFLDHLAWLDRSFAVHACRLGDPDDRLVAILFRDVTAQRRHAANAAFLDSIQDDFARLTSPDEIMQAVGAKASAFLDVATCNFVDVDEPAAQLTVSLSWSRADVPSLVGKFSLTAALSEQLVRASRDGETTIVRDTRSDPRLDPAEYAPRSVGAFVGVPFHSDGEWKFLLSVTDTHPRDWRDDEIEVIEELAHRLFPRLARARAEAALRESEQRLRRAMRVGAVGVLFYTLDGRILDANGAFEQLSGYTLAELRAAPPWERLIPAAHRAATMRAAVELATEGTTAPYESELTRKDGARRWGLFAPTRLSGSGEGAECVAFVLDITETKQIEAALRASEERYRSLFESIDEGYALCSLIVDAKGRPTDIRFLEVNKAFSRMSGLVHAAGKTAHELAPTVEPHWFEAAKRVVETGEPERLEAPAAGIGRWLDLHISRVSAAGGHTFAVVFQDVTERKRRESHLAFLAGVAEDFTHLESVDEIVQALGAKIESYFDVSRVAFFDVNERADTITTLYEKHRHAPARAPRESRHLSDAIGAADRDELRLGRVVAIDEVAGEGGAAAGAAARRGSRLLAPFAVDGQWRFVISIEKSEPNHWRPDERELLQDLAARLYLRLERARAESALRESEARFRVVANVVPDLLWQNRSDGEALWYNDRWFAYTGQTPAQAAGQGWREVIHPDDRRATSAAFEEALAGGFPLLREHRLRGVDGRYRWFLVRAQPMRDSSGQVTSWLGAATDIHEQRIALDEVERRVRERTRELAAANASLERAAVERTALRRQLTSAEEEERRRLARELHDQLGQHLTAIALSLAETRRLIEHGEPGAASRLAQLEALAQLLTRDARYLSLELRPPELDDVGFESALQTYVEQWTKRYGVEGEIEITGLASGQPLPTEVSTALYRITQEALTNVAKHAGASQVSVVVEKPDHEVRLIVEDNGRGFDLEGASQRIRAERRLGLASMRERAALVGGTLDVESSPGRGTTVYVRVPLGDRS